MEYFIQKIIEKHKEDTWFLSVFNWSGKEVCHPDITKVGQQVNSNQTLLASLKEQNSSDDLYDLLVDKNGEKIGKTEVIYIAPLKNADLIVAAHVSLNEITSQMSTLKNNFYLIFLIMGVLVIILSFLAVRYIGSTYEKQLELKNSDLASEVINLSKLNTDLVSYKEKVVEVIKEEEEATSEEIVESTTEEKAKQRILTYIRNELVPIKINDIAYIYTENTITYIVDDSEKKSFSNASLDEIYSDLDDRIFFRANRQFIIHIGKIEKIIKYGKSQLKIVIVNSDVEILIRKNKVAKFKQWLNI